MNTREELSQVAESVCQVEGAELYWLDYRQGGNRAIVKVFIEKDGGVTVEDCARVSRALELRFDKQIPHRYLLEVSSPGIERQLHTEEHFRRALGKLIRIKMDRAVEGRRVIDGRLIGLHPRLVLEADFGPVRISWSDLAQARILSPCG
jgi:ribosome maturation factor RimP